MMMAAAAAAKPAADSHESATRTRGSRGRNGTRGGIRHADIVRDWRYATRGGQPWPLYEGGRGPRGGVGVTRVGGDGGL